MEEKKAGNRNELSPEEMERVSGGDQHTLNTGISGLNGALRDKPRKNSRQIGSIQNGSIVEVYSETLTYDSESRRNFVMVKYNEKTGWVAASFVGLPR